MSFDFDNQLLGLVRFFVSDDDGLWIWFVFWIRNWV